MVQRAYTIQDVIGQLNGDSATDLQDTNPENVTQMVSDEMDMALSVGEALTAPMPKPSGKWGVAAWGSFSW